MMELIVLGQVPGTSIQLTFSQVSLIWLCAAVFLVFGYEAHRKKDINKPKKTSTNDSCS